MNREEALQESAKWDWLSCDEFEIVDPEYSDEWRWTILNGDTILTHSVHDPITRADWQDARQGIANPAPTVDPTLAPNKYQRTVPSTTIDVYDVLTAYSVTNPATQHAIKKLLQPGNRGHKDTLTDLREALASIQRAIQIEEQSCQQ